MKGRAKREAGGANEPEEDLKTRPERRVNAPKIEDAAEERKAGGRTRYKKGGMVHHERMSQLKHAKHVGPVHGEMKTHAGRKPRKTGGAASNENPFSSARKGEDPPGHKPNASFD